MEARGQQSVKKVATTFIRELINEASKLATAKEAYDYLMTKGKSKLCLKDLNYAIWQVGIQFGNNGKKEEEFILIQNLYHKVPNFWQFRLSYARLLKGKQRYEEALNVLQDRNNKKVLLEDYQEMWLCYCLILEKANKTSEAVKQFELLIKKFPDYIKAYFAYGLNRFMNGQYSHAESIFKELLAKRSSHWRALYYLGCTLKAMKEYGECIRITTQAIEALPLSIPSQPNNHDKARIYHMLAFALTKDNQIEESDKAYQTLFKLFPDYWPGLKTYAMLLSVNLNRDDDAIQCMEQAIEIVESNPVFKPKNDIELADVYHTYAIYLETARYIDAAERAYENFVYLFPSHWKGRLNYAVFLQKHCNENERSITQIEIIFDSLASNFPQKPTAYDNAAIYHTLGLAYLDLLDASKAKTYFETALQFDQDYAPASSDLAKLDSKTYGTRRNNQAGLRSRKCLKLFDHARRVNPTRFDTKHATPKQTHAVILEQNNALSLNENDDIFSQSKTIDQAPDIHNKPRRRRKSKTPKKTQTKTDTKLLFNIEYDTGVIDFVEKKESRRRSNRTKVIALEITSENESNLSSAADTIVSQEELHSIKMPNIIPAENLVFNMQNDASYYQESEDKNNKAISRKTTQKTEVTLSNCALTLWRAVTSCCPSIRLTNNHRDASYSI